MQKGWGLFNLETVFASVSVAMGIPRTDVGVGGGLYSEVQYIGNGHMGTPCAQTDTHLWKHYLPATSLAGGKLEC